MSVLKDVFGKVDSMAHSFAKYVVTGLSWFVKHEPQIADVFGATLAYVMPLLVDLAGLGEVSPAMLKSLTTIAQKLTAVKSLIYDWGVTGGTVAQMQSVLADLQSIEAAAFVKSDAAKAILERFAKEIESALAGYQAQLPTA